MLSSPMRAAGPGPVAMVSHAVSDGKRDESAPISIRVNSFGSGQVNGLDNVAHCMESIKSQVTLLFLGFYMVVLLVAVLS